MLLEWFLIWTIMEESGVSNLFRDSDISQKLISNLLQVIQLPGQHAGANVRVHTIG